MSMLKSVNGRKSPYPTDKYVNTSEEGNQTERRAEVNQVLRGNYTTLLCSMSMEGMGPSLAAEGATNREVFETYVERILAPTLRRGQVVLMDNLTAHKGERIRELIEGKGCELMYLSPYSPDFNSIEEAFSKLKGLTRKAEARSREALLEAMGRAISALSAEDARGFFEHCGYRAMVQAF